MPRVRHATITRAAGTNASKAVRARGFNSLVCAARTGEQLRNHRHLHRQRERLDRALDRRELLRGHELLDERTHQLADLQRPELVAQALRQLEQPLVLDVAQRRLGRHPGLLARPAHKRHHAPHTATDTATRHQV